VVKTRVKRYNSTRVSVDLWEETWGGREERAGCSVRERVSGHVKTDDGDAVRDADAPHWQANGREREKMT
jgi:hypothetical protein